MSCMLSPCDIYFCLYESCQGAQNITRDSSKLSLNSDKMVNRSKVDIIKYIDLIFLNVHVQSSTN